MKNTVQPPLEGRGKPALDSPMKDNPAANRVPEMGSSMGPDSPDMANGYSKGSLYGEPMSMLYPMDEDGDMMEDMMEGIDDD